MKIWRNGSFDRFGTTHRRCQAKVGFLAAEYRICCVTESPLVWNTTCSLNFDSAGECETTSQLCSHSRTDCQSAERYLTPVPSLLNAEALLGPKGGKYMPGLGLLRNFGMPLAAVFVMGCFSNAGAQTTYKITDLGPEGKDDLQCAMSVNDFGWTEIMAATMPPDSVDNILGTLLTGRALIDVDGFKFDLGTLGGKNTWMNWGEINNFGQIVGYSETATPDSNGEDICGFGTHATCRPFLWQFGHMNALPLLGGNNGEASAINTRGQAVGSAENGELDPSCAAGTTNNRVQSPVMWENGKAHALPTVDKEPDGMAFWINDEGQAVGQSGTCGANGVHAVSWQNGKATQLDDYGQGATAYGNNNRGEIVGTIINADDTIQEIAIWQNGALTSVAPFSEDAGALATGVNDRDQVVGSTYDNNLNWAHGFLYEHGVLSDINTLIPESGNLCVTMANKINANGQISGMAVVQSGPYKGQIHAFVATPGMERSGESAAAACSTLPTPNATTSVNKQLVQKSKLHVVQP
jgi:probable HAF family extracellular repeat protein